MELSAHYQKITELSERMSILSEHLKLEEKKDRLEEVKLELENPDVWSDPDKAQSLGKERVQLDNLCETFSKSSSILSDAKELLEMADSENDIDTVNGIVADLDETESLISKYEFERMFSGEMDRNSAYLDIQSGSGGTEAQDWAEMLLRMYLRWADDKGFKAELVECSAGDVAGIKSATIQVSGDYAFGWLRTEIGVHRLVRKSPFDSSNRRHTSFAAIYVSPEIDDNIDIEINPSDVRTDTYRASGAGGQHVNKTDSAVRLTHEPTGIVVQCQNQRSQHQNRDKCWQMLRARLYELELRKRQEAAQATEDDKSDIGWGSQIRSYVLDDARIKDLRTGVETRNTQAVLDGKLDQFIVASLKAGL